MKQPLSQEYLKSILHYEPKTGDFTWLVDHPRAIIGSIAGGCHHKGYREIRINGKSYRAHRLAFLWMTGSFPVEVVDHINNITNDNRWNNLRACTNSENLINSGKSKRNTSGYKGVHWVRGKGKWRSEIRYKGKSRYLGYFDCKHKAAKAYNTAALELCSKFAYLNEIK